MYRNFSSTSPEASNPIMDALGVKMYPDLADGNEREVRGEASTIIYDVLLYSAVSW